MASVIFDPDYQEDYYPEIYWHGTSVGWLAEGGFKLGLVQFGETASPQTFIWLHANQRRARKHAQTSIELHESRIKAGMDDPFLEAPHRAAKYVYRVKITPFATTLDMWEPHLSAEKLEIVIQAVSKTASQLTPFRWRVTSLNRGIGWLWGTFVGTRPRDKLLSEPSGWFKWLCSELDFNHLEGRDNECWRRLALFCKNANIDIIKHPKARFHENGNRMRHDADNVAEWAIMNLQRELNGHMVGAGSQRTYKIVGAYAIWPQKLLPNARPPSRHGDGMSD